MSLNAFLEECKNLRRNQQTQGKPPKRGLTVEECHLALSHGTGATVSDPLRQPLIALSNPAQTTPPQGAFPLE
jgi:hypothetical protein